MADLVRTISEIRRRIALARKRRLREQDTKATLIEPLLRALGWNTEDFDEVQHEFKARPKHNPVDYGLVLEGKPRLLLEAKALGENLSDGKCDLQVMTYATSAGVGWAVLTNGDEYRIYNTIERVSIEEKLFRQVRISEDSPQLRPTLELLARDRWVENRIDVLWRAHFVDRRVREAVEQLFDRDHDMLLVNHVLKTADALSADEVRESLGRCRVSLEFPMPEGPEAAAGKRSTILRGGATTREARAAATRSDVSVADLTAAGLLSLPAELERKYRGVLLRASIEPDGRVRFGKQRYDSLSTAASAARAQIIGLRAGGRFPATNGWTFWKLRRADGESVELASLRSKVADKRNRGAAG